MKYIKNSRGDRPSFNTFISYLKPIVNVLSRIDHIDIINNYRIAINMMNYLNNITLSYKKQNIMNIDALGDIKKVEYGNKHYIKESINNCTLKNEERALAACYLFFPTRRIEDYQYMKMTNIIENVTDTENNYFVVDDGNKIKTFVFNKYKTSKTYNT